MDNPGYLTSSTGHGGAPPPYTAAPPTGFNPNYIPPQAFKDQPHGAVPYPGSYQDGAPVGYMGGSIPNYQQPTVVHVYQPASSVAIVGGCPACRIGILEDDFPICGLLCAIFFFPLGILCCLAMREKRCSNCGAVFG